eukprot:CAMPEP_0201550478 /NCGR_PEP_ID=MMETSP0173_2-20130828/6824_1 /ASSEMBLY_ACC=CAM_ASM_000268 /TAXON_ID=218659 /ORGANISM="Vexillifera sp., Strain DIVA3 564/2" /LENGTH=1040 /DNA_ID=CAMNT_0047960453 /DNA_START=697 /DNA_END=3819 /DNA_ORIENTATION=-
MIFEVIGTPTQGEIDKLRTPDARKFVRSLGYKPRADFSKLFPNAPPPALDLLNKLLEFNWEKRITVEQALAHPYLKNLHNPKEEPSAPSVFDFDFEKWNITGKHVYKQLVWKEIIKFHPELQQQQFSQQHFSQPQQQQQQQSSKTVPAKKSGPVSQDLPPRESSLFKVVIKFCDNKQYDKGIKQADTILNRFPRHGETLAMKGLMMSQLGYQEKAFELVRQGLRENIRSHICWHVHGLVHRADKNYREAIKCYQQSLRIKPNMQVLRDLSMLQAQCRDMVGFTATRHKILQMKPASKLHWLTFSLGQCLSGSPAKASNVIQTYLNARGGQESPTKSIDRFELSEILLYQALMLKKQARYKEAIDFLIKEQPRITDVYGMLEQLYHLYMVSNQFDEAYAICTQLIHRNCENLDYHRWLYQVEYQRSSFSDASSSSSSSDLATASSPTPDHAGSSIIRRLQSQQITKLLTFYDELAKREPRADAPHRQPLEWLPADHAEFEQRADNYLRPKIRRGVPSLFVSIKSVLLLDKEKRAIIGQLVSNYLDALSEHARFPDAKPDEEEPPTALLWTLVFLCQFYDLNGHYEKALTSIDKAIEHTPTAVDLYPFKGKVLKHLGDLKGAAEIYEQARKLDLADRYLNTRCAKRMYRSDQIDRAANIIAFFIKEDEKVDTYLYDMQCIWAELECAEAHFRLAQYGPALKQFNAVLNHFDEFIADQMDFHQYCGRKATIRAYLEMIEFVDSIRASKQYVRATTGLIKCYLHLDGAKTSDSSPTVSQGKYAGLSDAERKKAMAKERKAQQQAKAAKAAQAILNTRSGKSAKKSKKKKYEPKETLHYVRDDPNGEKLVATDKPLEQAAKALRLAAPFNKKSASLHTVAFEVYLRTGKFLLALQALNRVVNNEDSPAKHHLMSMRFFHAAAQAKETLHPLTKQMIADQQQANGFGDDLVAANNAFLANNKHSLACIVAASKVCQILDSSQSPDKLAAPVLAFQTDQSTANTYQLIEQYKEAIEFLQSIDQKDQATALKEKLSQQFDKTPYFGEH